MKEKRIGALSPPPHHSADYTDANNDANDDGTGLNAEHCLL